MLIFAGADASRITSGGSSSSSFSSSSSSCSSSGFGSLTSSRPGGSALRRREASARFLPHDDKFVVHWRSKAQRRINIAAISSSRVLASLAYFQLGLSLPSRFLVAARACGGSTVCVRYHSPSSVDHLSYPPFAGITTNLSRLETQADRMNRCSSSHRRDTATLAVA